MYSHNIAARSRSKQLPPHVRTRPPLEGKSVSRSAARAMDIMEHFAQADRPLRAIEVAQAIGLQASTTAQLLKTMVASGHLLFNADDKVYFPSPRLVRFAMWLSDRYFGDDRISKILSNVCTEANRYVALFAQNDIYMQIVEHASPADQAPMGEIGVKVPIFGSACGAVLLSDQSAEAVERLMEKARVPEPDRADFMQAIEKARADGYAFGGLSPDDGARTIAIALPRSRAGVPLVIGLGGPASEISASQNELLSVLRRALGTWF